MKKAVKEIKYSKAIITVGVVIAVLAAFFAGAYVDDIKIATAVDDSYLNGRDYIGGNMASESVGGGYIGNNVTADNVSLTDNRKIIKTVTETVQTESFDGFISSIKVYVCEEGGRIDSERTSGNNYYKTDNLRTAYFVIRIPAEKLAAFTSKVGEIGVVSSYSENKTDVTEIYIDIESRIAVLEAKEISLLSMLSSAVTVSDLLEIDKRITDVQSELASLKRQKESYDNRIEYSTVNLTVNEVRRTMTDNPTFGESVRNEFFRSLDDIGAGVENLGIFLFGNIVYILIVAAFFVLAVLGSKFVIGKKKNRNIQNQISSEGDKL